jgi:DNA helicase II / ATP-dependent DNA helicase PcrA
MPLTQTQIQAAQNWQHAIAHDPARQVHVVAGPGTGKSSTIEERVCWLVGQGVQPVAISAVSFTRASALDLRQRIHAHCSRNGYPTASQVRVTTLHSLALRTLRAAGLLNAYPTEPLVLDTWELEYIFDAEFGHTSKIGKVRSEKIRQDHEAFWNTGQWSPPNYAPPTPPISAAERSQFTAFHGPRTQSYSCVLPGEIVRQCVTYMMAGTLNAVALLNLEHLVVDEFQDLNPMDLQFVDMMATQGAQLFVAGDDDQSIYSFRFASPAGIQNFIMQYPLCSQHTLNACFRCTPSILETGEALIAANPPLNRLLKNNFSLYREAIPPLNGNVYRWRFPSAVVEARAIAGSCRDLISSGISARDILVLLSGLSNKFFRF